MARRTLTERFIETVKDPGYYWDYLPGFGIRVGKHRKTFTVIRGKRRERITIGLWPSITLQDARRRAKALLGTTPRSGTSTPFLEALDNFIEKHVDLLKSGKGMERILRKHFTWLKSLHLVTRHDVQAVLDELKDTPSEANHAFKYIRTFFLWCVRRGILDHSPIHAMRMPYKDPPRLRTLSDDELTAIWNACGDDTFSRTVKLLILTGCRKSEIQHLTLDGTNAILPASHSKNNKEHIFPLPSLALPLFGELNFNGWSKAKARLDKHSGIKSWTLHDLRRTYATLHAKLGTPIHITEKLLNHTSGTFGGIVSTYNKYSYLDEQRKAVDAYETFIQSLLARAN
jgi:integrase